MTQTQTAAPAAPVAPAATPAAPATAAHGAQLQGVSQTAMQTGPMTVPSMSMGHAELGEGGETSASNGNDNGGDWGQWVAIGLISLTLVSLIMQIAVHRSSLKKQGVDDDTIRKDLREVTTNVKKMMGDKYETLG
jgi:hypothetical protein